MKGFKMAFLIKLIIYMIVILNNQIGPKLLAQDGAVTVTDSMVFQWYLDYPIAKNFLETEFSQFFDDSEQDSTLHMDVNIYKNPRTGEKFMISRLSADWVMVMPMGNIEFKVSKQAVKEDSVLVIGRPYDKKTEKAIEKLIDKLDKGEIKGKKKPK